MILKLLIFFSLYLDEPVLVQSTPTRKQLQEYRENVESKSKLETTQLGDVMNVETKSKLKTMHQSDVLAPPRLLQDITLTRNNLIDTIPVDDYPEQFVLTFKIYPQGKINKHSSILRYTSTTDNCCRYGDRWLSLWFNPNSYSLLLIAGSTVDGNKAISENGVVGDKWNDIKIEAIGDTINLYINGMLKGSVPNTNRPATELNIYASDSHYDSANAKISDFTLTRVESPERACLPDTEFELHANGCTYSKLLTSIQQKLHDYDPMAHEVIPCYHSAAKELSYHLPSNTTDVEAYINSLCEQAHEDYKNEHQVPWFNVTQQGDKFDKEYYDGNGDWNEEHQSNYPHPPVIPGQASNVLNRDAERVDDLYETNLQRYPLTWPGDSPTSITNFESCELQSAMCCWVSDRQANDNNGNCATPYDERCLDADPGDNTDLCAVDMARSTKDSTHVDDGFAIFRAGEEGPVHCHGLAWGQDEMEPSFRYRANNLFYVSMSDHLHDRGYVRNVHGAPMCGCVEHMPIVSRSDCTEIEAKEFFRFKFPAEYSGDIQATLEYVDLTFNACRGRQNNNLERYVERLRDEGRLSKAIYYKFRNTVVGDNQCDNAIRDLLFDKGYTYKARTADEFTPFQNGYCVKTDGNKQNSGVITVGKGTYTDDESKQQCLELCATYSTEHRVTGCEISQQKQSCYVHTQEVFRGNGVSQHFCAIMNQREPATKEQLLPTEAGFCVTSSGSDQNSGVVKVWGGDFGPSDEKKMECLDKCIAASAVRKVTGCEAIWGQGNRGCYIHTREVARGNNVDRHSCWVL